MELHYQTEDGDSWATAPKGYFLLIGTNIHLPYALASRPLLASVVGGRWRFDESSDDLFVQGVCLDGGPVHRQLRLADSSPIQLIGQPGLDTEFRSLLGESEAWTLNAVASGAVEIYDADMRRRAWWPVGADRWRGWSEGGGVRNLGARLIIQPALLPAIVQPGPRSRLSPLATRLD